MSTKKRFAVTDAGELREIIRASPLAAVVCAGPEGLDVHHIPLYLEGEALRGHMARANPLAQRDGAEVVAIFRVADGYVTPSWYPSKAEHGRVVPTWNYVVAHAYGRLRLVEDRAWLRAQLEALTRSREEGRESPWNVSDAPGDYLEKMMGAIVAFEIALERLEGVRKASQNREERDREGVRAGFEAERGPEAARRLTAG